MSATKYRILLHQTVPGEIQKLPDPVKQRIKDIIDALQDTPIPSQAVRLKGRPSAYCVRVAEYRLVYEVHATEIVVFIVGVAHRKEVYQRVLRRR